MPRRKRLGLYEQSNELAAMKLCREAMVRVETHCKIGSPEYRAASEVMTKIDDLAELFTGDRKVLWTD